MQDWLTSVAIAREYFRCSSATSKISCYEIDYTPLIFTTLLNTVSAQKNGIVRGLVFDSISNHIAGGATVTLPGDTIQYNAGSFKTPHRFLISLIFA